jgi:2,4-dienoyl-CoA reductase-like NADH-dependent reductase (Old Yellow Enzyme family)
MTPTQPNHAAVNRAAPNVEGYFPLTEPAIGSLLPTGRYPQNQNAPKLFQPLTIRNVTYKNRIWVSPMCQYSAVDGETTDWHLVHLGSFATRGAGSITMEATAVTPEGRISPQDTGIWSDTHIPNLKRIVNFAHAHGTKIGIQLAHAGRKASTNAPWAVTAGAPNTAPYEQAGWPDNVLGPSDLAYSDNYPKPKAMTKKQLDELEEAFVAAIERSKKIGFDHIELHMAHGYLLSSFLSPLSNKRSDEYGGSLENRMRLPLRIARRARQEWPDKPLFVRISATEWAEGPEKSESGEWLQWGVEQSIVFAKELQKIGVDLLDVSSGGNWHKQKIKAEPGYQVELAAQIKAAAPTLLITALGLITDARQAEQYLQDGKADVAMVAREFNRHVDFALAAAEQLGVTAQSAVQYERSYPAVLKGKTRL